MPRCTQSITTLLFQNPQNDMKSKETFLQEFEAVAKPVNDFLRRNFHPHTVIVIDYDGAHVYEALMGVPKLYKENPILQPEKK